MKSTIRFPLKTTQEQFERLVLLQNAFAKVCNAISPVAQSNRCWNRVALHHLTYKLMREAYPAMGSQMICNAIYSVSRGYRMLDAIMKIEPNKFKNVAAGLPRLVFLPSLPVYFDRHTLSIKDQNLSMFTLDGRMQFAFKLSQDKLERFQKSRIKEIMLLRKKNGFELQFWFVDIDDFEKIEGKARQDLPEYLVFAPQNELIAEAA